MTTQAQPQPVPTSRALAEKLQGRFPGVLSGPSEFRGELTLDLADATRVAEVCAVAKGELGFDYLVDITSIDNYGEDPRFTIVYHLYGYHHLQYLRLRTAISEETGQLPTVTTVWQGANWHEREIYDMMGIRFSGHPDLRRILMWEGYPFYPLRKDFPVSGKPTQLPEVAFTESAPLAGGPFVTVAGGKDSLSREPRVRNPESDSVELNARLERRQDVSQAHGRAHGPGPVDPQK